jgi:hypothetical protein
MPLNIEKIRKLMGEKSEYEVAATAGIGRQTLRRMLAGRDFLWSNLEKLATYFGVSAKGLIE